MLLLVSDPGRIVESIRFNQAICQHVLFDTKIQLTLWQGLKTTMAPPGIIPNVPVIAATQMLVVARRYALMKLLTLLVMDLLVTIEVEPTVSLVLLAARDPLQARIQESVVPPGMVST